MHCTCLMPIAGATPLVTPTTRPNPDGTVTVTPPPFETACTRCNLLAYVHTIAEGDPTFQRFYSPAVLGEPVLRVKLLHPLARPPHRATEGSSGLDLYSIEDVVIPSLVKAIATTSALMLEGVAVTRVRTGLAVAVPRGWEVQARSRSGIADKGLVIPNGLGTVDSDYRGGR